MEREAFRQRMQQYKQARESNPQLKYWDWKKYADGGEVRDNTYVAPVYKEQVFIPATGAQKIKNDYQYKYGSKSPYILKYLKSLPDTDSIKKAALQFKNLDDYIKWLNTMPLADNGNINEIENYNFA